jgi:glutamate dehydrogenase
MESKLDAAKTELLQAAVKAAADRPPASAGSTGDMSTEALEILLRRYYRHAAPEDLVGRDPVDVLGAALSHRDLAASRPQGTATVRVHTPARDAEGWSTGGTVVEVVTDDMPSLVASVTAELSRQGHPIRLVLHPQLNVRRALTGELKEICDVTNPAYAPAGSIHESWIHVEIDRISDAAREEVGGNLRRVLRDVREAYEDLPKMRARVLGIAADLDAAVRAASEGDVPPDASTDPTKPWLGDAADVRDLLRWLADDRFTFLGYREYDLASQEGEEVLAAVAGTGLGILRADQPISAGYSKLTPRGREKAHEPKLLVLTKANSRSTVQRPAYLDYVGVKKFDADGKVVGERRFLGLFTTEAYTESVTQIPLLARKTRQVLAAFGFDPMSYSGRDLLYILQTYPRDELFQISTDELVDVVRDVMHLQERRKVKLFLRKETYGRYVSALVYMPRDRYSTEVRLRMQEILLRELNGSVVDYTLYNTESVLSRLHFVVRGAPGVDLASPDVETVERMLTAAARTWTDDVAAALEAEYGEVRGAELTRRYAPLFPEGYKADFTPAAAVQDVGRLEELRGRADGEGAFSLGLYRRPDAAPGERSFKIYRLGQAISLSEVLPVLQRMGMEVVDEHPYELAPGGNGEGHNHVDGAVERDVAWVYDFGLRSAQGSAVALDEAGEQRFCEAFSAAWTGRAENDGFNALVPLAGLSWRQASVLRAYTKYLRQGGSPFGQDYFEQVLVENAPLARLLVRLFEARLDPAHQAAGSEVVDGLVEEINGALDNVASLDQERILKSLLAVITATLRTNYFQRTPEGDYKACISVKLDPQSVPDLPLPRPKYEIWVYSPRVEGVHLRFGKVARGGLRWSDRRQDFRTEVLGLVKAQMVKNTVIVPVGSKGGFVCKQLPDPSDRIAWMAEGVACYQTFIRGMLDITDNLVPDTSGGTVVPPPDVVRHDGDDTYLVVAADKGTATFSDIANKVAAEYGYWLGDAFASGGSAGYDHKAMGITARGAWESVKRHFRELGVDTQTQDFTVIGVGDMSGDVFGNGMLLSRHIRLVAAFDHRHIFLDPNPDSATSYVERERLFNLPRSSWADYSAELISAGGGVYPRTAKSIPLTPQVKAALGIDPELGKLTPAELMHAILQAPVDLFWNGGIGTYVKATTETHADVGDRANDAIRINGSELRVKVVGEGGNLGLTQLGRIEYALTGGPDGAGGAVNNDAVDNSAGVDTSDHEVNIKILLDRVIAAGGMTTEQRNELLATMTDEVGRLVLRNNYGQNVALASAMYQANSLLHVHQRYLRRLVRAGHLNRALEFLPTDRQIAERRNAGIGLVQPEFSVLLAYTKIVLADELLASDLPEDPYLREELYDYFPSALRERFRDQMDAHPLRREIITTQVVNNVVNNAGTTFVFRMREESGASSSEIARAHAVSRVIFDMQRYWSAIDALDNQVPAAVQTRMRLDARRLAERASRWFLINRRHPLDIAAQVDYFHDGVAELWSRLPELVRGANAERVRRVSAELTEAGVPEQLATEVAGMSAIYSALDIVEVAQDCGRGVVEVADVYFYIADTLQVATMMDRIVALPRDDRWQTTARSALRDDLYAAHASLTFDVLACGGPTATPEERFTAWAEQNQAVLSRASQVLEDISASDTFDLAILSVAMRTIRTMLRTSAMT